MLSHPKFIITFHSISNFKYFHSWVPMHNKTLFGRWWCYPMFMFNYIMTSTFRFNLFFLFSEKYFLTFTQHLKLIKKNFRSDFPHSSCYNTPRAYNKPTIAKWIPIDDWEREQIELKLKFSCNFLSAGLKWEMFTMIIICHSCFKNRFSKSQANEHVEWDYVMCVFVWVFASIFNTFRPVNLLGFFFIALEIYDGYALYVINDLSFAIFCDG